MAERTALQAQPSEPHGYTDPLEYMIARAAWSALSKFRATHDRMPTWLFAILGRWEGPDTPAQLRMWAGDHPPKRAVRRDLERRFRGELRARRIPPGEQVADEPPLWAGEGPAPDERWERHGAEGGLDA